MNLGHTAPAGGVRARARQWWHARLPRSDHHRTTQRNVYIVPSAAGWCFAAVLMVLLVASINYQLSLGYALTFLLAGSALVSMHLTHATLRGLTLSLRTPAPVFASQAARLDIEVDNPGRARYGIGLATLDDAGQPLAPVWIDVPARGRHTAQLRFVVPRRGWQALPALSAHTRFPFGLFHAWTVWRPASRVLVWPQPEQPAPPLPAGHAARIGVGVTPAPDPVGFEGVRPWRRGDSMRQIAWKKVARAAQGELVSRDSVAPARLELWLDWHDARTPDADLESRLSRLAAWVLQAEARKLVFGLRLPGSEVTLSSGEAQRHAALSALAQYR